MLKTLVCVALLSVVLACDGDDCDNADMGTCGNACCSVFFVIKGKTTVEVKDILLKTLSDGGPDGGYAVQGTAGALDVKDFEDLREYGIGVDFIGQAIHTTRVARYNDTLDFTISSEGSDTVIKAFSISDIGGALGDHGQNYKNLVLVAKSLGVDFQLKPNFGCPPPTPSSAKDEMRAIVV